MDLRVREIREMRGEDDKRDLIGLRYARVGMKNLQMAGKYANFVNDSNDFSNLCRNTAQWNQELLAKI